MRIMKKKKLKRKIAKAICTHLMNSFGCEVLVRSSISVDEIYKKLVCDSNLNDYESGTAEYIYHSFILIEGSNDDISIEHPIIKSCYCPWNDTLEITQYEPTSSITLNNFYKEKNKGVIYE